MIALRSMSFGGKAGWTNPYITDGLVAMWDGEWNAGGGVHDASATSWRELVSGTDCEWSLSATPTWDAKAWRSLSYKDGGYFRAFWPDGIATEHTIEILAQKDSGNRGAVIGAYNIPGANYVSMEWYGNRNFRAYYNGQPDNTSPVDSFPVGVPTYMASRHEGNVYDIVDKIGNAIKTITNNNNRLVGSTAYIGCDNRTTSMCFFGRIHSIRIYDRALTAAEVAANFAVDKARFGLP